VKGAVVHTGIRSGATLSAISPLFVVGDLEQALTFYRDRLGFEVTHQAPVPDPFFAIVVRDGVQLMLKVVAEDVGALPNRSRHPYARWDAYVHVPDPDTLAAEYRDRGVTFSASLTDTDDGLRGFELTDNDGYVLFFGRPV
jgi:catechol 2,3-dioxygenase-like lactoylglutathione lyase family enzyme